MVNVPLRPSPGAVRDNCAAGCEQDPESRLRSSGSKPPASALLSTVVGHQYAFLQRKRPWCRKEEGTHGRTPGRSSPTQDGWLAPPAPSLRLPCFLPRESGDAPRRQVRSATADAERPHPSPSPSPPLLPGPHLPEDGNEPAEPRHPHADPVRLSMRWHPAACRQPGLQLR